MSNEDCKVKGFGVEAEEDMMLPCPKANTGGISIVTAGVGSGTFPLDGSASTGVRLGW